MSGTCTGNCRQRQLSGRLYTHLLCLDNCKLAFRRTQNFGARLGSGYTLLSCAFLSNPAFYGLAEGMFLKKVDGKAGMFSEILGWTFFGNTLFETRASCTLAGQLRIVSMASCRYSSAKRIYKHTIFCCNSNLVVVLFLLSLLVYCSIYSIFFYFFLAQIIEFYQPFTQPCRSRRS